MIECENCLASHDGTFGSGRFCSKFCSRAFSTKIKRAEISEKVSNKLTGRKLSKEHIQSLKDVWEPREGSGRRRIPAKEVLIENSWYSVSFAKHKLFEEHIKEYKCEECGIKDTYNGKPLVLQIHHLNGRNADHRIHNLQILCPNCHSQTDNYAGKNRMPS